MRKLAVISGAALLLAGTWTAVASDNNLDLQPAANAYLSLDFGHPNPSKATFAPLHYGLRMTYDSRQRSAALAAMPPLAQFDFDTRGNRIGMVGGVPFMAKIRPPLKQNDGDGGYEGGTAGEPGGIEFFDLALLGVGIAGLGYLIYEVAQNDESPNPPPAETTGGGGGLLGGGDGGLLGGLLGGDTGGTTGDTTGGTTGGGDTGGLLGGLLGGFAPNRIALQGERNVEYQQWLDGGTGHMGDLDR